MREHALLADLIYLFRVYAATTQEQTVLQKRERNNRARQGTVIEVLQTVLSHYALLRTNASPTSAISKLDLALGRVAGLPRLSHSGNGIYRAGYPFAGDRSVLFELGVISRIGKIHPAQLSRHSRLIVTDHTASRMPAQWTAYFPQRS